MPTKSSIASTATVLNVDPTDVGTGQAIINMIMAVVTADRRAAHLRKGVESIQFHEKHGVGVLCKDAGVREHLANALRFPSKTTDGQRTREGLPVVRTGRILDVEVKIWNVEV